MGARVGRDERALGCLRTTSADEAYLKIQMLVECSPNISQAKQTNQFYRDACVRGTKPSCTCQATSTSCWTTALMAAAEAAAGRAMGAWGASKTL